MVSSGERDWPAIAPCNTSLEGDKVVLHDARRGGVSDDIRSTGTMPANRVLSLKRESALFCLNERL